MIAGRLYELNTVFPMEGRVLNHMFDQDGKEKVVFSSDICPLGPLGRANFRAIAAMAPELDGTGGLFGVYDARLVLSEQSFRTLSDAIERLSDHPALSDDLLAKVEQEDREAWWLNGGRLLVNSVLWSAAYDADVEHEIEIAYFKGFVSWAAAYGVNVYEKEEWGINGDYSIDTEWVDAVAAETYKSKGE